MSKEINLEEILFSSKFKGLTDTEKVLVRDGIVEYSWNDILLAMKEACRKTLELAAENAKILHKYYDKHDNYKKYCEFAGTFTERCDGDGIPYGVDVYDVNRKSILDTINQIR